MDTADYFQRHDPELRARVARELRRAEIPDEVWGRLHCDGLPYEAITSGSAEVFEEIVSAARGYLKEWNARPRDGRSSANLPPERSKSSLPREVAVELDEYHEHRAQVFSAVAATLADRRPDVRRFRAEYLDGVETRLTEEQAARLLYEFGPKFSFEDGRPKRDYSFVLTDRIRGDILEVQSELSRVARKLAEAYRWRLEEALWFMLTGHEPRVRPLRVKVNLIETSDAPSSSDMRYQAYPEAGLETGHITLVAEPWVDADLIADVYRSVQRQVLKGDNRKKDRRTLDAVLFVARQLRERRSASWDELRKAWNDSQPDSKRHYKSRKGIHQAFARFVRPKYDKPRFRPFAPEPWQEYADAQRRRAAAKRTQMSPESGEFFNSLARGEPGELHEP